MAMARNPIVTGINEEVEKQFKICEEICDRVMNFIKNSDTLFGGFFLISLGFGKGLETRLMDRIYNIVINHFPRDELYESTIIGKQYETTVTKKDRMLILKLGQPISSKSYLFFRIAGKFQDLPHSAKLIYKGVKKILGCKISEEYCIRFVTDDYESALDIQRRLERSYANNLHYLRHCKIAFNQESVYETLMREREQVRKMQLSSHPYTQVCDSSEMHTNDTTHTQGSTPQVCDSSEVEIRTKNTTVTQADTPKTIAEPTSEEKFIQSDERQID